MKRTINWQAQRTRKRDSRFKQHEAQSKRQFGRRMTGYYDKQGRRISMWRWANLTEGRKYGSIGFTRTRSHLVTTRWFGIELDLSYGPPTRPIQFESMVFCFHDDAPAKRERNRQRMFSVGRQHLVGEDVDIAAFGKEFEKVGCKLDCYALRSRFLNHAQRTHNRMVKAVYQYEREIAGIGDGSYPSADMPDLWDETAEGEEG